MNKYDITKTLFVSDLDGTLLKSDGTMAEETVAAINEMTARGLKFSFATARSYYTAMQVASEITADIPIILHNGVFIRDNLSGRRIVENLLDDVPYIKSVLTSHGIHPMVYTLNGETEKYTYVPELLSREAAEFQATREGDPRDNPIHDAERIWDGTVFYVLCIDTEDALRPAYEQLRERYNCIFARDYYSGEMWLEILAQSASKASAVLQLRDLLGCEKTVVFGDAENDIPMFEAANEAYAVANAIDALKKRATAIIGSNDENAVITWLRRNVSFE
ncbi:MAG: HAD family hydrolase [Clostridia bacterium]|nr:HAD family hydrolase [Clostridia bacterium]